MSNEIIMDKKYTTRTGRPVRLLCVDGPNKEHPVIGIVENKCVDMWNLKGISFFHGDHNLIEAKTKREAWLNICSNFHGIRWVSEIFDSEKEAIKSKVSDAIVTIRIEWEE